MTQANFTPENVSDDEPSRGFRQKTRNNFNYLQIAINAFQSWVQKALDDIRTTIIKPAVRGGFAINDVRYFGTLANAIAQIPSGSTQTLYITNAQTLTADLAVPSNISIVVLKGGSIGGAHTITFNGPFESGVYQAFTNSITAVFGYGSTRTVNPIWWGAVGDGATDDTSPLQAAFTAVGAYGGIYILPKPSVAYLISGAVGSGEVGLETGTTFVHVIGYGSKIKQKSTTNPYTMFRFRSNMTIEGVELEGYVDSGNSDANVVPQSGYGFRGKRISGSMDNVAFINCISYGHSFDGWYLDDQNSGGSVRLINCTGYNCVRNDFAAVQVKNWIIDGGTWGQDTVSYNKNASIDCEPDSGKAVLNAEVRNATCFYKLSFAADAGTGYNAVVDGVTFDGSVKGADTGLYGGNFRTLRVDGIQYINSAQTFRYNSFYYDPAGGGPQVLRGRFIIQNGSQPQIPNEIPYTCARKAGWTSNITGSGTITDDVNIGDRNGIKFLNPAGGHAYLSKNVAATAGVKYSFGCLLRFDASLPTASAGIWVVVNGAATTQKYLLIPAVADTVEYVCGSFIAPTGTTSVDVFIGTDAATSISLTVADVYFTEGIADNESVAGFSKAIQSAIPITAFGGVDITGGVVADGRIYKDATDGLATQAIAGATYDWIIYGPGGSYALIRNPHNTQDLQFPGHGTNTFSGDVKLGVVGKGIYIKEGTDACMGLATLVAGVAVVSTTKVTANSRIFLTRQSLGGTLGTSVDVTARTAGTSFTITAQGSILDTSTVAWEIKEPA